MPLGCSKCDYSVFEAWSVLDSQSFLVRHRRNRVWGAAVLNNGKQSQEDFEKTFKSCLNAMKTQCQFSMEETFLDFPKDDLRTHAQQENVRCALKLATDVTYL